jgi:hypothetical protein
MNDPYQKADRRSSNGWPCRHVGRLNRPHSGEQGLSTVNMDRKPQCAIWDQFTLGQPLEGPFGTETIDD